MERYCVYILASLSRHIYIGVTNDMRKRLFQHRTGDPTASSFAKRYKMNRLVYVEFYDEPYEAISREKQLKGWRREKKVALIEKQNPEWFDMAPGLRLAAPLPGR